MTARFQPVSDATVVFSNLVAAKLEATDTNPGPLSPEKNQDWLLWQLADSAFPTGGFAHSGGLEAAWQHGEVRNRAELTCFVEASLRQFGHGSLPFMTAAHDAPEEFNELNHLCESCVTNHVANRASRLQGRALLTSAERIFMSPALRLLQESIEREEYFSHLAPVFGAVLRAMEIDRSSAARLFFFLHLRGLMAGAVRLGIVGPMEAQALQFHFASRLEEQLVFYQALPVEKIAQTAPLLEIWQGAQDRLYSRLFQS